jgi:hypothetical protein
MDFKKSLLYKIAGFNHKIEDMPLTLIVKPYKIFIKAALRLCALFSLLVFISFSPIITLILAVVYILLLYMTNIFINFCVKFGYKKIMLVIIFALLYFLCFTAVTNLRHFLAGLYFH